MWAGCSLAAPAFVDALFASWRRVATVHDKPYNTFTLQLMFIASCDRCMLTLLFLSSPTMILHSMTSTACILTPEVGVRQSNPRSPHSDSLYGHCSSFGFCYPVSGSAVSVGLCAKPGFNCRIALCCTLQDITKPQLFLIAVATR